MQADNVNPPATDTSGAGAAVQARVLRGMPAWRKVNLVEDANRKGVSAFDQAEFERRQGEDGRGIVRVQADDLDREYLLKWADRLSLRDLLDRLLLER